MVGGLKVVKGIGVNGAIILQFPQDVGDSFHFFFEDIFTMEGEMKGRERLVFQGAQVLNPSYGYFSLLGSAKHYIDRKLSMLRLL